MCIISVFELICLISTDTRFFVLFFCYLQSIPKCRDHSVFASLQDEYTFICYMLHWKKNLKSDETSDGQGRVQGRFHISIQMLCRRRKCSFEILVSYCLFLGYYLLKQRIYIKHALTKCSKLAFMVAHHALSKIIFLSIHAKFQLPVDT